jgi:hypothetical protein
MFAPLEYEEDGAVDFVADGDDGANSQSRRRT